MLKALLPVLTVLAFFSNSAHAQVASENLSVENLVQAEEKIVVLDSQRVRNANDIVNSSIVSVCVVQADCGTATAIANILTWNILETSVEEEFEIQAAQQLKQQNVTGELAQAQSILEEKLAVLSNEVSAKKFQQGEFKETVTVQRLREYQTYATLKLQKDAESLARLKAL